MKYAKIDLHLHLDGSLYLPWAWETAKKRGVVAPDYTFDEYYHFMHRTEFKSREERMTRFDFPIAVLQTKEDLAAGIYHLIETLAEKDMYYAEIRFAPQQHMLQGLTQTEVVEAVLEGRAQAKKDFPGVETGIINCMMHKGADAHTNWEANLETIRVTKEFLGKGVVALDLAGFENNGDFSLYGPLFEIAKEQGLPYTIHAGEMGDGSHIPLAISWGASRIGHGIDSVRNPEWLKEVVEKQIPLEVCVTGNTIAMYNRKYCDHPVRKLIEAGVKVTLNTDNMTFSETDLINEYSQMRALGVSMETLKRCAQNSIDAAFCDEETKDRLRKKMGFI
ncbi:MAG: adenosine deaminase [Lachnospiraceae bacterium]|nr:adenosine deaminase [Lachnospiraceae bacterium]